MYKNYKELPPEYRTECAEPGTLVRITYPSETCGSAPRPLSKEALVYLPYGYDTANEDYNVFYLMHGGGGNADTMFGGTEAREPLKHIFDHMIAGGDMSPLIVVTPTFYHEGTESAFRSTVDARELTQNFHRELQNDLIPAVERRFRTKKGREHRAFGGFSMGAEATWNVFAKCLRDFRYFLPMSGDCWAIRLKGGLDCPAETVEYLTAAVRQSGMKTDGFRIFAGVGDDDIAYEPMNTMLCEMERRGECFLFGNTYAEGNLIYCMLPGGQHSSAYCDRYMYNGLPLFFKD